jgi:hypothetical protein
VRTSELKKTFSVWHRARQLQSAKFDVRENPLTADKTARLVGEREQRQRNRLAEREQGERERVAELRKEVRRAMSP